MNGNGKAAAQGPRLMSHHRAELQKSGLDLTTIRKCQFESIAGGEQVRRILGWDGDASCLGACLLIPYFDRNGHRRDDYRHRLASAVATVGQKWLAANP